MPALSLVAAFTAIVVGTLIGTLLLSLSTVPGAQTGQPAMVLLRGLFGGRLSYLPTALNLMQCLGWAVFELVVIANAAEALLPWKVHWPYVVLAGVAHHGAGAAPARHDPGAAPVRAGRGGRRDRVLPDPVRPAPAAARSNHGSWSGFWLAADALIAVSVSWVPLAADYSRHSRSPRIGVRRLVPRLHASPRWPITRWACWPSRR